MAFFSHLNITDARERTLVGVLDASLAVGAKVLARRRSLPAASALRRVLVFRLERIGDLVMTLDALADLRAALPAAHIALVVGRWNLELAALIPYVNEVIEISLPWIARHEGRDSWTAVARKARALAADGWDLGINFEPDIRSNILLALTGARHRLGFSSGGGGAALTVAQPYDATRHTALNAQRLLSPLTRDAYPAGGRPPTRLVVPAQAHRRLADVLREAGVPAGMPYLAVHVSGGRAIKQWPPERFSEAAGVLALEHEAFVIFTGSEADRALVDYSMAALPRNVHAVSLVGRLGLVDLAALFSVTTMVLTGDTGPMHLAAAVGAPVVAVFGPSSPARYAPTRAAARVVRIDLPCSPCNRIRQPPLRCQGHTPDCLAGVTTAAVVAAARELWAWPRPPTEVGGTL